MTTHLVIPDAHAHPDFSNDRFDWLGNFIIDRKPDVIIDIGDWYDMPSLCSYDRGKKSFEGRRYSRDIEAGNDARERCDGPTKRHNDYQRRNKHKLYIPRKVALGGNHDDGRISRAVELQPELEGAIGLDDIDPKRYGWEYHRFLVPVIIDGILYCHYVPSGNKGNPVSGEHPAASLITKKFMSTVVGHSHVRDFAQRTRGDGTPILGLVAGCFFDYWMDYAGECNNMWWRGIVMLHNVKNGNYEAEFISMNMLKDMYG